MIRETLKVKLTDEFKKKAMDKIDETINYVSKRHNVELNAKEKLKIKNLSLDQVNINISQRTKSKTIWVFDTEPYVPVTVEVQDELSPIRSFLNKNKNSNFYQMRSNLSWTFNEENAQNEGITHQQFEDKVLEILLEDFETASFYGTLSYVTEE